MSDLDEYQVVDVKDAAGPPVQDGDRILLMYRAAFSEEDLNRGATIESTYSPDIPIEIDVRADRLLPGVYRALIGVRTGGAIRRVTIGPSLAFAERGWGPVPPGAALVIELCVSRITSCTNKAEVIHETRVQR